MATTVNYTVTPITEAGVAWDGLSAHQTVGTVGPDTFANTGRELFYIKNTGAQMTVTFTSGNTCNYGTDHDLVVTIAATTGEEMIGPFPIERFGATVTVTLSRLTAVVCDVIQLAFK
jgi:hypothetical protein